MGRPKKYQINENYFNQDFSENHYYILGFCYADGSFSKRMGLSFAQQIRDRCILDFILKCFGSNHPIKIFEIRGREYVRLSIVNKKMISSILEQFDIPFNKSQDNLSFPKIPDLFKKDFLRGYFDGDGSIWCDKVKDYSVGFCGGLSFLKEIQLILADLKINTSIRHRYGKKNTKSCQLEFKGSFQIEKFYNYIYVDGSFCLERKKNKFKYPIEKAKKTRSKDSKKNGNWDKILKMYSLGVTQKEISIKENIHYSVVRGCVQRMRREGLVI